MQEGIRGRLTEKRVRMTLAGWTNSQGEARLRTQDAQGQQTDRHRQTDDSPAEKSHSFQRPPHPETLPGAGKIPQSPLPVLPCGVPTHTSGRGSWQAPQEPFYAGGVRAGGRRDEERGVAGGRAGSGQRLHKGPSVCPSCPWVQI